MEFPAYVPVAVREYVTKLIEGDSGVPKGWQGALADAERRLAEIDEKIQSCIRLRRDDCLSELRKERAEAAAHRDDLAGDIDCLRRLVQDERMREAYAILTREFTDERQWRNFIYAAWAARVDFAKYRDRLKRATELAGEIARAAETLAKVIRQFSETGINGPSEFYSVPALLRETDNYELGGRDLHMWRSMRRYVLGDPPRDVQGEKPAEEGGEPMSPIEIVRLPIGEKPEITPEERVRSTVRYAWGIAPGVSALLETLAGAARAFKPSAPGMIGAAIESRQRNPKTEYLRALGELLIDVHGFALTTPIVKAMAITATVVLNLPDASSYDDARKALARLGVERLENSS
jgi:hypothetical protein